MRVTLSLLFLSVIGISGFSQTISYNCPPNIDFENNGFSHWQCYTGNALVNNNQNQINLIETGPVAGRHEIISSATDMDEFGAFPKLCPYGDRYSVKLGNRSTGGEAEGMSYTFQIPLLDDTFSLTYYYAVVFEDPNHSRQEQPRFFVSAYDAITGAVINCASYDYVSTASIPGFQKSLVDSGVLFKDWTPASIDFSGLGGRTIKLEFRTADCTLGGHFGYAYFDVSTGCGGVIANAAYCTETRNAILNAPYGFETYTWFNSDYSAIVGHDRTVTLSPPPAVTSTFHVDMIPYPGYGCRDTAFAKLTILPVPDTPVVVNPIINYCQFDNSSTLSATGVLGNTILWYTTGSGGTASTIAPKPSTATAGNFDYYVTQKKLFGCESFRTKTTVAISPTPLNSFAVNNTRQCEEVNNFVFTNNSTNTVANRQYVWDFGDGVTDTAFNQAHVYRTYGNYNVSLKVLNPPVCGSESVVSVVVVPKPLAKFSYPQTICEQITPVTLIDKSVVPSGLGVINKWWWKIAGNNAISTSNPAAFFSNPGPLPVQLVVTTTEGCRSDTTSAIIPVHYLPLTSFKFSEALCSNEVIHFTDQSAMPGAAAPEYVAKWKWEVDNVFNSSLRNPADLFTPGLHHIKLTPESNAGCAGKTADSIIFIYSKPYITLNINDSCVFRNIVYTANTTPGPAVAKWYWDTGNGLKPGPVSFSKIYTNNQYNLITLIGETGEGCRDTLYRPFTIYYNRANAGRDTLVAMEQPLYLNAGGEPGTRYEWLPSTGLNNPDIEQPVALYDRDLLYTLNTISKEGCDSHSKIFVKRFKGPDLYVANAFTPNGDYTNDVLHVFPVGIKSFGYFAVYNRLGQRIYHTTDYHQGWNGTFNGTRCDAGNYVYYTTAIDYKGAPLTRKGNVLLLR